MNTGRGVLVLTAVLAVATVKAQDRRLAPPPGSGEEPAPRRLALVIGNRDYTKVTTLINPIHDATDVAAELRKSTHGFDVDLVTDVDQRALDLAVERFAGKLRPGDVALFYFAGHGLQLDGENYLLPLNFEATHKADVRYRALAAGWVRDVLRERGAALSILILDACRDNPFRGVRGSGGGLAAMSGAGAYIAFAAEEGRTAADNPGERNGLFTKHLLEALAEPGLRIDEVFNRVRTGVYASSEGAQTPFTYSGLIGEFVFHRAGGATPAAPMPRPTVTGPGTPPGGMVPGVTRLPAGLRWEGIEIVREVDGMEMKRIPAGTFRMGSELGYDDEKPVHPVRITRDFLMDRHEVTVGQYHRVMGSVPDGQVGADSHPVVHVRWDDARGYCRKVGGRLPAEAEWEIGGRGGLEGKAYPWGDEAVCGARGCRANGLGDVDGFERSAPVCSFEANGYGLCDMAGNVWEWVWDRYGSYPSSSVTDPEGPPAGDSRVLRGGSWDFEPANLRVALRDRFVPDNRYNGFGFRCARDLR